jgi:hypothetical protein
VITGIRASVPLLGPRRTFGEAIHIASDDVLTWNQIAEARAAASELAVRSTAALAVREGSRSVTVDQHAARLAREARFLLVFGSRPGIRSALLRRFGASAGVG